MGEALIFDALRTPRGRGRPSGSLHEVKPISMVIGLLASLRERNPELDPASIEDVVLGVVSPLRDQGAVIARIAALAAGLPRSVPGLQLNRFCGSGLEAVNNAAQRVRAGWEHLIVAGGVESMSRVPMGSDGGAWALDPETNYRTRFVPQGIGADLIATIDGFSRDDVDAYALESQVRAHRAWEEGRFARSVVPVTDRNGLEVLTRDELLRPESTLASLGALPAAFAAVGGHAFDEVALQKYHWIERIDHVHTAGNSSGIVDGAALVLIGDEDAGRRAGLAPRGRIAAVAVTGTDPTIMLTGPAPAARIALERAGIGVEDLDAVEINEAFAGVVLRFMRELDVPHAKTNINGGAIAMGHPLGATGAMLVGTVLDELERINGRYGLVALCVGGGMGIATVVEKV